MRDSRSGSPLQLGFRDYNLCKAKPQLEHMPHAYYTAFLYTDTPTFSDGEGIGEAKKQKKRNQQNPHPHWFEAEAPRGACFASLLVV